MSDLLVRLYDLPENTAKRNCENEGFVIRTAIAPEMHIVQNFVKKHFNRHWAGEITVAFARIPIAVVVAIDDGEIVGFAAYDATCRSFFGPTGVAKSHRGRGIGEALLIEALTNLRSMGYAYGIIGNVGDALTFYQKVIEPQVIEGSTPGFYRGMLQ